MISIEELKKILGPDYIELSEEEYLQLRSDVYEIVNQILDAEIGKQPPEGKDRTVSASHQLSK
ncbi:MAG: hypothetical protein Q8P27_00670 [Candidatus Peregrinibacteria bacterium]|nr:hypothetical protein [Candidatus Peregrinibacteria bacterium]